MILCVGMRKQMIENLNKLIDEVYFLLHFVLIFVHNLCPNDSRTQIF
jgi:hypothetical protein